MGVQFCVQNTPDPARRSLLPNTRAQSLCLPRSRVLADSRAPREDHLPMKKSFGI